MPEFIESGTGEVHGDEPEGFSSESERQVLSKLSARDLLAYTPLDPSSVEAMVWTLGERLEHVGQVIVVLYEEKHRAEEAYQLAFSKSVVNSPNKQISFAREYAKHHTADELHALNLAKEKLRYAEEMQKSLQSKHYGYMNISKSVNAQFTGMARSMGMGGGL